MVVDGSLSGGAGMHADVDRQCDLGTGRINNSESEATAEAEDRPTVQA